MCSERCDMCKEQKMKFDITDRRKETLKIVKDFTSDFGKEDVPIILADIKDKESLKKMTELAKILISYCDLCRFYGESVIKVCILTRSHYVNVTAEEEFMERMQLKYNVAQNTNVYIVSACDCLCSLRLGIIFTQQKFEREINAVEIYIN